MERLRAVAGSVWARALVSAGLLAAVATQIDTGRLEDRIAAGNWGWLAGAVAALVASLLVGARRWSAFLESAGIPIGRAEALRAYFMGAFALNLLPSQVGGDVARAWIVTRPGTRVRGGTTVLVDRVSAVGCLVLIAWVVLAAEAGTVPGELVGALGLATGVLVVGVVAAALAATTSGRLGRTVTRVGGIGREFRATAAACLRPRTLVETTVLGLVYEGFVVLSVWLVALALNVDVPFAALAVTFPPILIVAALPVSIGGLGIREGGYAVLLSQVGVSATDATLLSLGTALTFAVASLPGALGFLVGTGRRTGGVQEQTAAASLDATGTGEGGGPAFPRR